jgi:hypothetical protein
VRIPSEPAATARVSRLGLASAALIGPWGIVLGNLGYAWATRHGGSDETSRGALELAAAHPLSGLAATIAAMIGSMLLVPATLGAIRLTRVRAARLGLLGGALMIAGYVCYFAMLFHGALIDSIVANSGPTDAQIAVVDAMTDQPLDVAVSMLFLVGNLIGTLLLGLALLRSHAVPAWAACGVLAWPVLHLAGLFVGSEWVEVAGAVLQGVGFAVVGSRVLRLRLPEAADNLVPEPLTRT